MNAKQQKLTDSILAAVAIHGWTDAAIIKGAKQAKLTPAEARKIFPAIDAVVAAFHQMIDARMLAAIKANRKFPALRVRDKITFAVKARLLSIEEHEEAMRRLLAWSMLPRNLPGAMKNLWSAADQIWCAAGDTSTDYNRYTKRLLLIGVMKATLTFWLNDTSKARAETWKFLDRRIQDVMMVGKTISAARGLDLSDIATLARTALRRFA